METEPTAGVELPPCQSSPSLSRPIPRPAASAGPGTEVRPSCLACRHIVASGRDTLEGYDRR